MGDSDNERTAGGRETGTAVRTAPTRPRIRRLPPWQVLLHNDDVNDKPYVVETIITLTTLNRHDAVLRMLEAHNKGLALLVTTHREHAELLGEQFHSKRLKVTIEPAN